MPQSVTIADLMESSQVKFGTSGARGKVSDLTDTVCYAYTMGFLQHLRDSDQLGEGRFVATAGDLRPSSPDILRAAHQAIADFGLQTIYCGEIPSPAVAFFGFQRDMPSLMVTGSHIPDDRNGIKFNTPTGEITKQDEIGIKAQTVTTPDYSHTCDQLPIVDDRAKNLFIERNIEAFGDDALSGMHIGVYQHTTVGRDLLVDLLKALGAKVSTRGRAVKFVPVDTEAVREEDVQFAAQWAEDDKTLDSIVSADGDADRPLVSDENGKWIRGDVLGIIVSQYLLADAVATPVSSNTALEKCGDFKATERTKIGSPFVIEAMQALAKKVTGRVVGYEANGGFLTQSEIMLKSILKPLPTRDCVLPIVATLHFANKQRKAVSKLVEALPARFTASDRLQEFATEKSQALLAKISADTAELAAFIERDSSDIASIDKTDGLRITLQNQDILHFRPSGNAPEFRCYAESSSADGVETLLAHGMHCIAQAK